MNKKEAYNKTIEIFGETAFVSIGKCKLHHKYTYKCPECGWIGTVDNYKRKTILCKKCRKNRAICLPTVLKYCLYKGHDYNSCPGNKRYYQIGYVVCNLFYEIKGEGNSWENAFEDYLNNENYFKNQCKKESKK